MSDPFELINSTLIQYNTNAPNANLITNADAIYVPYSQRPETYIVPLLFFVIFVLGVLGNGTLVIIFLRHQSMRNVPNIYIFSLALADLFVILISVPFTSVIYTLESWPWGEHICKLSEVAKDISIGVSVFTLTALSADRFFAIVSPLRSVHTTGDGHEATKVTILIAVVIWILAIICAVPAALGSHLRYIKDEDTNIDFTVCYPFPMEWFNKKYPQVIITLKFLLLYVIPLLIITIFYLNMASHLIRSTKNIPGELQGTKKQAAARKKVALIVLIFVILFALCLLPTHLFMLFFYFHPHASELYNPFWHYLRICGFCLCYLNSCVNPVALYWLSATFRKHFNRYLPFLRSQCMGRLSQRRASSIKTNSSQPSSYRRCPDQTVHFGAANTSIVLME